MFPVRHPFRHPPRPVSPRVHPGRAVAIAIAAALGAAGCGTGEGTTGGGGDGGDGAAAATTTISPLSALMGWTNDSPEEGRRKQLQVEQLVAECMREEGWEYTPVDYAAQDQPAADPDAELQMTDPVAFGEKHGYGVAYYYDLYEADTLANGTETASGGKPQAMGRDGSVTDPNAEYVASLSTSEQEEYNASLYGKQSAVDGGYSTSAADATIDGTAAASAPVAVSLADQGCYGQADAQVYPQNEAANDPDVQARMNDYWDGLQQLPELVAAYEDWAACMSKDGEIVGPTGDPVTTPNDMYSYVDGLKSAALGLEAQPMTQDELNKGGDYYSASMDANGKGIAWVGDATPMSDAALEELRTTEVRLWKLDHACQVTARIAEIQAEAEQHFVDDLKAEFPELAGGGS